MKYLQCCAGSKGLRTHQLWSVSKSSVSPFCTGTGSRNALSLVSGPTLPAAVEVFQNIWESWLEMPLKVILPMFSHSPVDTESWITGLGFFPLSFSPFSLPDSVGGSVKWTVPHVTVLFWAAVFLHSFILLPSQPCRTAFQPAERECLPIVSPACVWSSDCVKLHSNMEMWREFFFSLSLSLFAQFKRMPWTCFYINVTVQWFQSRAWLWIGCEKLLCSWLLFQNYLLPGHWQKSIQSLGFKFYSLVQFLMDVLQREQQMMCLPEYKVTGNKIFLLVQAKSISSSESGIPF